MRRKFTLLSYLVHFQSIAKCLHIQTHIKKYPKIYLIRPVWQMQLMWFLPVTPSHQIDCPSPRIGETGECQKGAVVMSLISYTPFTFFMLQEKWHVDVSNVVDFMTRKLIFIKKIICLAIVVLKIQLFDLHKLK